LEILFNKRKNNVKNFYFLFFVFLSFVSCSEPSKESLKPPLEISGEAMGMGYSIILPAPEANEEEQVIFTVIKETFLEIDTVYNNWNPNSEISQLNNLKAGDRKKVSPELIRLLSLANEAFLLTQGRFDPTVGPAKEKWLQSLDQGKSLSQEEISEVQKLVGWDKIHIENGEFFKDVDGVKIDLGGIAKGYGVDLLYERLSSQNTKPVFVQWSGEIRASQAHPHSRPWKVQILSPKGSVFAKEQLDIINLENQSIATSGDYLQTWPVTDELGNIEIYTHIVDPKTCCVLKHSKNQVTSFTVLADSCAFADALATAGMMFSSAGELKDWTNGIKLNYPKISFWGFSKQESLL
jgi:FAD:protein FMN transferase